MKPTTPKVKKKHEGEELTLKIDGRLISPEDFKKAVQSFVEILLNVTDEIARGGKKPLWNMSVREGSTILVATAVADVETRKVAREAIKRVKSGVGSIEKGRFEPGIFPQKTLYAVRELAGLHAKVNRLGIDTVEFGNGDGKKFPLTIKTTDVLKKNLGSQKSAYGSLEGKLSTISERGTFQFVIFDALTDRGINCFVPQDKFKEAHASFGRRVNVFGKIQYDREGKPLSIKVEKIRAFRDLSELPPVASFLGILKVA